MIEYKLKDVEPEKWHTMTLEDIVKELTRKAYLEKQYAELINEVVNKVKGETRHETAVRIIKESYLSNLEYGFDTK